MYQGPSYMFRCETLVVLSKSIKEEIKTLYTLHVTDKMGVCVCVFAGLQDSLLSDIVMDIIQIHFRIF